MRIKCKSSGKFLATVNTEKFYDILNKTLKATIDLPLEIEFYCKGCKRTETYIIFKNNYVRKKEKNDR